MRMNLTARFAGLAIATFLISGAAHATDDRRDSTPQFPAPGLQNSTDSSSGYSGAMFSPTEQAPWMTQPHNPVSMAPPKMDMDGGMGMGQGGGMPGMGGGMNNKWIDKLKEADPQQYERFMTDMERQKKIQSILADYGEKKISRDEVEAKLMPLMQEEINSELKFLKIDIERMTKRISELESDKTQGSDRSARKRFDQLIAIYDEERN